jgi:hypothetical protein
LYTNVKLNNRTFNDDGIVRSINAAADWADGENKEEDEEQQRRKLLNAGHSHHLTPLKLLREWALTLLNSFGFCQAFLIFTGLTKSESGGAIGNSPKVFFFLSHFTFESLFQTPVLI